MIRDDREIIQVHVGPDLVLRILDITLDESLEENNGFYLLIFYVRKYPKNKCIHEQLHRSSAACYFNFNFEF